jgi:hypothetical protein
MRAIHGLVVALFTLSSAAAASAAHAQAAAPPAPAAPPAAPAASPASAVPHAQPPAVPAPSAAVPAEGKPTPKPLPPAAPADPEALVHIDSSEPVQLVRRHGANVVWWHVCWSPCDVSAPLGDEYLLAGEKVNRSKPFRLEPGADGRVLLRVKPGVKAKHTTGLAFLAGGGVLALLGTTVLAVGIDPSVTFQNDALTHNENTTAIAVGSLLIVGGVAAGITGGAWALDNAYTTVGAGAVPARRDIEPLPPPQTGPASARRPEGPAWIVPLVRATF